jgi:RNA polymerase sigma factor (sigma-70 family)
VVAGAGRWRAPPWRDPTHNASNSYFQICSPAWAATIANGLVANHWRRRALEQAYLDALIAQPVAFAPSPEERLLILETLEDIARLLDGLPPAVCEAFLLSQLDGLTYPQIAERLGLTVNVVQKAMARALAHCYQALYTPAS